MQVQNYFKRYEIKYLLSEEKYEKVRHAIEDRTVTDEYGKNTICNIYYDTPDSRIIRRSIEAPIYKEKLRLRSYGIAERGKTVFLELKKKYDGIVYKRREDMTYESAQAFLRDPEPHSQITEEIAYFIDFYEGLRADTFISYSREAFYEKGNRELRITFDSDILARDYDLNLTSGIYGKPILPQKTVLMEIKTGGAIPLWLTDILSREEIYKTSFSKFGRAYELRAKSADKEAVYV